MSERLSLLVSLAIGVSACGGGYVKRLSMSREAPGTCEKVTLERGESCRRGRIDSEVGASVVIPTGEPGVTGASVSWRFPMESYSVLTFHIDERELRRADDSLSYASLAGGLSTHLRPIDYYWPQIGRFLEVTLGGGLDLGALKVHSKVRGRFDGFVESGVEVFLPDVAGLRFMGQGVPGIRVSVRRTWLVEEWFSETSFQGGLVWRWGHPVDFYEKWQLQRTGD